MGRAPCCDKASVKKGPWSPEEDAKLKDYIEKYGTGGNWIALPQKVGLKRCGKSCRLRWLNYLRPNIKHGGFSEEEDNLICRLYISIGSRWSIIAAQLPGRTDNDIKNYWNTRLKKKLLGRQKQMNGDQGTNGASENRKNSAIERLQLHMQLQSRQNPLSFYNNPLLWPKLQSLQEEATQESLKASNDGPTIHSLSERGHEQDYSQQVSPKFVPLQENYAGTEELKVLELDSSSSGISNSSDSYNSMESNVLLKSQGIEQPATSFQAELDNILNNRNFSSLSSQREKVPYDHFDCFKDIDVSKDGLVWWSNEFDAISVTPSNARDSAPVFRSEGVFQDYDQLDYSL